MSSVRMQPVWNCPALRQPLAVTCPQTWHGLPETADPTVRSCGVCERQVHLCSTPGEFVRAAEQGHCVAIPRQAFPIGLSAHQVGQPSPESVKTFRAELRYLVDWWGTVVRQAPEALGDGLEWVRNAVAAREPAVREDHGDAPAAS